MAKMHFCCDDMLAFFCPGCGHVHRVPVHEGNDTDGTWGWNGSMDRPTLSPSIRVFKGEPETTCHSFVRDGQIQFLNDCFHRLKGQTVEIPDWDAPIDNEVL